MFKEMAQPRPQDAINQLDRQDQSLIFQFRTQHTRTNQHLNRINPLHQPHCRHCDNPAETTEHLLLYCPNLQLKRKELLPTNPTIHSTLYGQLDQLKKTSTFIRLALTVQEWRIQQFGINNNNTTTTLVSTRNRTQSFKMANNTSVSHNFASMDLRRIYIENLFSTLLIKFTCTKSTFEKVSMFSIL